MNKALRKLCGVQKILKERVEMSVLRWYGHIVKIDELRTVKKVGRLSNK